MKDVDPASWIATSVVHPNPIRMCGQHVLVSHPSLYWQVAKDVMPFEGALYRIMSGQGDWREVARSFGVRYIFWGAQEKRDFPNSLYPWTNGDAHLMSSGSWGEIYDLGSEELVK